MQSQSNSEIFVLNYGVTMFFLWLWKISCLEI